MLAAWMPGCAPHPPFRRPAPVRYWPSTLAYAESSAAAGGYAAADSALVAFEARFPGTAQAVESEYWRALFKLDPHNVTSSPAAAVTAFDGYLALPDHSGHASEAAVLRRAAVQMSSMHGVAQTASEAADSARTQADSARAEVDSVKTARSLRYRSKQEEVQRLRDSLDKVLGKLAETNQELERIKKRLATSPPTPP
jgi:hypothetical protein